MVDSKAFDDPVEFNRFRPFTDRTDTPLTFEHFFILLRGDTELLFEFVSISSVTSTDT